MIVDSIYSLLAKLGPGAKVQAARVTGYASAASAQIEDDLLELAKAGRRFFGGVQIIANGIAPVAAIPTTTATLALYNGEPSGGKCLVIDGISFWLGSGTAAAGATLFGTVGGPIASPPTANGTGLGSWNARGYGSTKALWTTAMTVPGPANWMALLSTLQLAAANVGQGDARRDLRGGLVVPPGYALALGILSGAGTSPLYGVSGTWSELQLDLD